MLSGGANRVKPSFGTTTTILACVTLVRALVYCNFLREVRVGGWGSDGPKGPSLDQYVSACATIPLGSGSM